jgi:hypothetical protein
MVKLQVNGVEYCISPVPPRLAPHNALYSEMIMRKPKTVEEAEQIGKVIDELSAIILKATVSPTPKESEFSYVLPAVFEYTNKTLSREFFRGANPKDTVPQR